jgi:hypothetical protein
MRQTIIDAMAEAFFASAWVDLQNESENGMNLSGVETFDVMPDETDPAAIEAAEKLCYSIEGAHNETIAEIFRLLCNLTENEGDREHTPEMFGYYAAMQAMGHGVGLYNAFGPRAEIVNVPYMEFSPYNLEKDYF